MSIDGAAALSQLSGIPREKVLSIWEQVKANSARLKGCARHRFSGGKVKIGQKMTCLVCGGEMDLPRIGEYIRGYKAGGGSADDIWPEYEMPPAAPVQQPGGGT